MSDIKQIFLDLDGPLLDGKEKHYHCYRSILESHNFKPICIDEYWEKKRALVNRRVLLSLSGADEIYDHFFSEWLVMIETPEMLAFDKVQEGAVDCLRRWKARGIKLTLVTMRKNKRSLEKQLSLTGLHPLLDDVLVCDHTSGGEGKADAVRGMFQTNLIVNNTLWIGDTEADWEAAQSLGCNIVLVANGLRSEEYLGTLKSALVVSSISSIT